MGIGVGGVQNDGDLWNKCGDEGMFGDAGRGGDVHLSDIGSAVQVGW